MRLTKSILAGAVFLASWVSAASAGTELRFSSFEPPVAFITKEILTKWAKDVTADSEGTISVKIFAGGTLGRDPAQQLKLVEDGVADIGWIIPGYTPGRFQEGTVAELPFVVNASETGSTAIWSLYEQGLLKGDYDKFKIIGLFTSPPNFVASNVPILDPADMAGKNMRAPGPTLLSAVERLKAVPVGGITGPEVAESMSRGLIAGTLTQWSAVETFRIGEAANHYLSLPLGATPMMVVMNKAKFESLPEEARKAIDKHSGREFAKLFGSTFDENNGEARKRQEAKPGVTVIDPTVEQRAAWQDALKIATEEWIAKHENGRQIYDAFAAAIEKAGN